MCVCVCVCVFGMLGRVNVMCNYSFRSSHEPVAGHMSHSSVFMSNKAVEIVGVYDCVITVLEKRWRQVRL